MADESRSLVAVVGGFYGLDTDPKVGREVRKYAQALGSPLAEVGFGRVVNFSDDKLLEPHVVRGFVAALPSGKFDRASRSVIRKHSAAM